MTLKLYNFQEYLNLIKEGLIKTYDIDFVIEKSLQRLSVLNIRFDIIKNYNNTIKLSLYTFNKVYIDHLFDLLNSNFTNLFGWYPSYIYLTNISGMRNSMNYDENYIIKNYEYLDQVDIIYESKFDLTTEIPNKLYHLSIKEYKNKILKYGIIPKTKNKISTHGDRIYVCDNLENCKNLIPKMKFYFFNKNKKINTNWIIYEINTENLNNKLYNDSNYPGKGFYLLGNIHPSNIKIAGEE